MADLTVNEGELIVGHPLHQVPVVRDQEERSGPRVQQALHDSEHVDVQVVVRLIQYEHVRLVQEDEHQLKAALLSAGQIGHRRGQLRGLEPEPFQQLRRGQLLAIDLVARLVSREDLAHSAVCELVQLIEML